MRNSAYAIGILVLISVIGCTETRDAPDSQTIVQPPPPVTTPNTAPEIASNRPEPECSVRYLRRDILESLVHVLDSHTTRRTYNPETGTYKIDVRYFRFPSVVRDHAPLPPPDYREYVPGESKPTSHPIFDDNLQIATTTRSERGLEVTLLGELPGHPIYRYDNWEVEVTSTLDRETCHATLDRVVAGPHKIVLYPED